MNFGTQMFVKANFAIALLALFAFGGAACSAQQLNFSIDGGNTFGNSFNIAAGSSTDVEVYLSEIPPDTILSTEGLFSLGLNGDLDSAAFGSISAASIDPTFDFITAENSNTIALEWEAAVLVNVIPAAPSVRLGSFQFDSNGPGVSSFTFGDIRTSANSNNVNWLTEAGTELDELIFGAGSTNTYSLTLGTAIPEPGAVSLMMLCGMLLGFRRRSFARVV